MTAMLTTPIVVADKAARGTQFADQDVTRELGRIAEEYLVHGYDGDLEFMASLRAALDRYGSLTISQARGVLNVWVAALRREAAAVPVHTAPPGVACLESYHNDDV